MTHRLFALVSAISLAALASSASAQAPRGALGPNFSSRGGSVRDAFSGRPCRSEPYRCGVAAYDYFGPQSGVAWFRRAAREGSAPAMRSLGLIYLRGAEGVRADPAEAMGWFYEAALRDDAQSMYALARGFEEGVGVVADPQLAHFWLDRAAARGDRQASRALAALQ